jgi:hypothetical protein
MIIVLFIHVMDVFCPPFYNYNGLGMGADKPRRSKNEYVCVLNEGAVGFDNRSDCEPVVVKGYH